MLQFVTNDNKYLLIGFYVFLHLCESKAFRNKERLRKSKRK